MADKRSAFFKVEGSGVTMNKRYCPRCGAGVIMAEHKDRSACGKCGYTEFRK
jgi:ubiquitin-small subunit ribosomal protein S27Ae